MRRDPVLAKHLPVRQCIPLPVSRREGARRISCVAMPSIERRLDACLFALVVFPAHRDLVSRLCAANVEVDEGIFRYRLAPLRIHDGLAVVCGDDSLDEMQRDEVTGYGVLAQ